MKKFDELYSRIIAEATNRQITEGRHTLVFYRAVDSNGVTVGEDDDLFDLEQTLELSAEKNYEVGAEIKIYKVDQVLIERQELVETLTFQGDHWDHCKEECDEENEA